MAHGGQASELAHRDDGSKRAPSRSLVRTWPGSVDLEGSRAFVTLAAATFVRAIAGTASPASARAVRSRTLTYLPGCPGHQRQVANVSRTQSSSGCGPVEPVSYGKRLVAIHVTLTLMACFCADRADAYGRGR